MFVKFQIPRCGHLLVHGTLIGMMLLLMVEAKRSPEIEACSSEQRRSIGVVIDESSRVGREQKIAMELAVQDFRHCLNLVLHVRDEHGLSPAAATDLLNQVDAIVGTLTLEEAVFLSRLKPSIPIVSLSFPPPAPPNPPSLTHITPPIFYQTQCVAAITAHFRWRKLILIHEQPHTSSEASTLFSHLSHSLHAVGSSVEHHITIPRHDSLSDPKSFIEQELKKLRSMNVKVFVVLRSSLEFVVVLFAKARVLGMLEKGHVWIVSDEIANLLDSLDASVILNLEGVIGLKTGFSDASEQFKEFKSRFKRKYESEYPIEEDNSHPSIYSLRGYDAIGTIVRAFQNHSTQFVDFEGLSGKIAFKNGVLEQKPVFQIVNLIGRSYREVGFWSPDSGFSEGLKFDGGQMRVSKELSSIYWPGGGQNVPTGWSVGSRERPLRIGVPANGAFNQFVKVSYDPGRNRTQITGFSIEVFDAAVKKLHYDLHYVFVPYYGSYDEMVAAVDNKTLDAAVGDTEIIADRYLYAEFSQPYIESGLVMVVTVKAGIKESKFIALNPFTQMMWLQLAVLSIFSGGIVWFSEYATGNEQFINNSFLQTVTSILWLSVTIISLSQREHIKNSASKVVVAAWICVVFVVGASFTAVLSTMMTVPRLQPSIQEIDYLRNTNAVVGCNGNSFIVRYLIDVLNFRPENVKKINYIKEYPQAFQSDEIKAAFFVAPHAKVFLAEYCNGYIISGPTFRLGGFGFVFQKGSPLAIDVSEAILKVTQSGHVNTLEQNMLHLCNCTSSNKKEADEIRLGPGPFSGLFQVLGGILGVVFFIAMLRLLRMKWSSGNDFLQEILMKKRNYMWASLVLTECYTRFGSSFFREENVQVDVVDDYSMEPDMVEIQMTVNNR